MASSFSSPLADRPKGEFDCVAKSRYRQKDIPVHVKFLDDDHIEVSYGHVKAVTPGQACVLYDGEVCIGSAIIDEVYRGDTRLKV